VVVSALAIAFVLAALALRNRSSALAHWLPVVASVMIVVLAVTHFEVFEHQLLAGWAPEALQRIGITAALAFGAAVVGSELVTGLGATSTPDPVAVEPVSVEP
ncbi:MAG: hypothetical protein QOJ08_247, partial [Ilumatobacteraceae bacterium]